METIAEKKTFKLKTKINYHQNIYNNENDDDDNKNESSIIHQFG